MLLDDREQVRQHLPLIGRQLDALDHDTLTPAPDAVNRGTAGSNALRSLAGSDRLRSLAGSDRLRSLAGSDRLRSLAGSDRLRSLA
ncbi:MAG: hypothetical protein ACLP8S_02305, partial [Solirubrobacteraceae bacterium]